MNIYEELVVVENYLKSMHIAYTTDNIKGNVWSQEFLDQIKKTYDDIHELKKYL